MNALRITAALGAVGLAAANAGAQGKCDINQGTPFQLNSAKVYLKQAQSASGKPDERLKHLRNAVQVLTEKAEKIGNPVGRNWLLGKTLVVWLQQPNASYTMKRRDVGYTDNPDATVDVLAAADSAFDVVQQARPECADSVNYYRRVPGYQLVKRATDFFSAKQNDSAAIYATRSVDVLGPNAYAYNMLWQVAQQRGDDKATREYLRQTISAAGTDTMFTRVRRAAMLNLAVLTQNASENATGTEKDSLTRATVELYRAYLKEAPDDANAQAGLARALNATGDTAAVASMYAKMLQNPSSYSDIQLFEAGANAAAAQRNRDAASLLEAGLQKNPYFRDALFNLANTYFAMGEADKMEPVVKRLVDVDPNNPDNWRLYAGLYQLRQKAARSDARRKPYTDSLLANLQKSEKMPVRVSFSQFSHNGANHVLAGSVENRGDKPMNNVALKIDFLDQSGKVVASQTAQVGSVAPKASQSFSVNVNQAGIVAFRYAALPTT